MFSIDLGHQGSHNSTTKEDFQSCFIEWREQWGAFGVWRNIWRMINCNVSFIALFFKIKHPLYFVITLPGLFSFFSFLSLYPCTLADCVNLFFYVNLPLGFLLHSWMGLCVFHAVTSLLTLSPYFWSWDEGRVSRDQSRN